MSSVASSTTGSSIAGSGSREAMRRAAETLAEHAELLAAEMEGGTLSDRGGPDALRLFAAVVRATNQDAFGAVGHA
jgi:hypothetical protein